MFLPKTNLQIKINPIEYREVVIQLHPREVALIMALRKRFRFGEVIILMRDGVPQRLKKVEIFDDLEPEEVMHRVDS